MRVYTSCSDPIDFCKRCAAFITEPKAKALYGDVAKTGEGPDDRGNCFDYNSDHPDYSDTDYTCEKCNKPLTEEDN